MSNTRECEICQEQPATLEICVNKIEDDEYGGELDTIDACEACVRDKLSETFNLYWEDT